MGCDIHGWLETRYGSEEKWQPRLDIKVYVGRNYGIFGLLFGIRNYDNFAPIAPSRGFPTDASEQAKRDYEDWDSDAHSPTYITWAEIKKINWKSQVKSDYISAYQDGKYQYGAMGIGLLSSIEHKIIRSGKTVTRDGIEYKCDVVTPKEQISKDWKKIFAVMKDLARWRGDDNVRLVVWFDN